jgi:UDP-N-acetylglucosamine--N-acetylmuramyl-(pentapeptide) pyrophosphoryl-undecaprenol N-acetylglucosamine transferase
LNVLWVGGEGGMEARLVERAKLPFKSIPAAGVHGVGLRQLPGNLARLGRGVSHARRILHAFQPDVLFFTGGYVAVPMALAGMHIPSLLYVPDIEPGLALRTLSRFADRIAVTAEDSLHYFRCRARLVLTGYPVRPELSAWPRPKARAALGLASTNPVLLIFGGSKGARSLNNAVLANLPALLEMAEVVHITGELDWPDVEARKKELPPVQSVRWHTYPYLHEQMGAALSAADLVVSRAGAASLGEYPLFGLPAILVPYPHAWRYQKVNADFLVRRGAAMQLEDAQLQEKLLPAVKSLLADPTRLEAMQNAMRNLARPHAASEIGHLLMELANERR